MTSILKQENGELFIYRSEKEFPKEPNIPKVYGHIEADIMRSYEVDRENWFSSSERIKVAPDDLKEFLDYLVTQRGYGHFDMADFALKLYDPTGIEIPESCYEVRPECRYDIDGLNVAYFKDDRADKKETDEELEALTAKIIPYDESNKHNGPIHWEKHKNKIDKYRNAFIAGVRHSQAKRLHDPPQNPNKEEMKEHAIQFAEWLDSERYTRISTEHLYNQFINRK